MSNRVVVFDFETTGLSPNRGDRPIEVAAVLLENDQVIGRFHSLMNPGRSIPSFVQGLTGISDEMVVRAPSVERVMEQFHEFISDWPLVAHNAAFDQKFLDMELGRIGNRRMQQIICSMRVARRVFPGSPNHKLETLSLHANLEVSGRYHRAQADVDVTAQLWVLMQREIKRICCLDDVGLDLLEHIQGVPCAAMKENVESWKQRNERTS